MRRAPAVPAVQESELPTGWTVWHARPDDILVLTYRPDVFDADAFPPQCVPTLTVKPERTRGGRGRPRDPRRASSWVAELRLEPDVPLARRVAPDRGAAIDEGVALTEQFVAGEIDFVATYPDPHRPYLERLQELVETQE